MFVTDSPLDRAHAPTRKRHDRLTVDVHLQPGSNSTIARDVLEGLGNSPKTLPPKYFYDDTGSRLFDRICDTREYYQTRTEHALLEQVADDLMGGLEPSDLIELGSGAARKTRVLLDAAGRAGVRCRYVPFDVSESMLRDSATKLLSSYPWLGVHGIVGDYDRHLGQLPPGDRRLVVFLGSTIGNFAPDEAVLFLTRVARQLHAGDRLLLGTDLVKDHAVLDAAYNDSEGLTAEFNKNVLRVLNRELGASFDPARFEHVAFFNAEQSRIEMHLEAREAHRVRIAKLDMDVGFERGESIRTEISRKFTRQSVADLLAAAGLELIEWHTPENGYFGLSLARPR
jgi:L-histidine N-alpha-methyltransferase